MIHTKEAQREINLLTDNVIGLFKLDDEKAFNWVTKVNDNDTIDTMSISQFGIVSQLFSLPIKYGKLKLFPYGMSLTKFRAIEYEFFDFIDSFSPDSTFKF